VSSAEVFTPTARWAAVYPAAQAGVLVLRGVSNAADHPALAARQAALEQRLRAPL
jgi:hypothetical protein